MKISPSYLRFSATVLAGVLVFSLREPLVVNLGAQSLGDLARQERARKLARQPRVTKVFTNEDLNREFIITPEERAAMELAAAAEESQLAGNTPEQTPTEPVPVHLTLAPQAIPSKEIAAAEKNFVERAVPTVPIWPAGIPLGDIAHYYQQQIAPAIPAANDSLIQDALAQQPLPRDFSQDRLHLGLAVATTDDASAAPAAKLRNPARELHLSAPFVIANADGSSAPLIENVNDSTVPSFPSPTVRLAMASDAPTEASPNTAETLRFQAPDMSEVVLSFGADASLGIPSLGGSDLYAPMYDSSREPLTIRFAAPQAAPAPAFYSPSAERTTRPATEPNLSATAISTSSLESVTPWRYIDESPAAQPVPVQPQATRTVVASTAKQTAEAAEAQEVRVQRGDSLWKLAQRHLGDGNAWPQIADMNPELTNPNHILAGQRLRMPANSVAADAVKPSQPLVAVVEGGKSVVVRKGDSLWKLAETALGSGAAWSCIAGANPQIANANRIVAGQSLVLPASCNPQS